MSLKAPPFEGEKEERILRAKDSEWPKQAESSVYQRTDKIEITETIAACQGPAHV